MKFDDMKHVLEAAKSGDYDLDATLWSLYEQHGNPMPYYAEPWFQEARSQEDPAARLSTSMGAVLALLEDTFPEADLKIVSDESGVSVTVSGEVEGEEVRESCKDSVPLTKIGLVVARATFGVLHQREAILQRSYAAEPS